MAEVAICSLVRDGMSYLPAYRRQLESLVLADGDGWQLYILEGDSTDDSWEYLKRWSAEDPRVHCIQKHVGQAGGKEDLARRWAEVCNACFDSIPEDSNHTHVLWLEADLTFPSEVAGRLLEHRADVVAPVIFLGGQFYDAWGFRDLNGRHWTNHSPYHPDYAPARLLPMGSVGSCVLFRREILDAGVRMRGTYDDGLLVGMCNDAREKGFRVWADTGTAILHPVNNWERQMWRPRRVSVESSSGTYDVDPLEFAARGINPALPVLDSVAFVSAHYHFFKKQFRRLRTNRLDVDIQARSAPSRRYEMTVRAAKRKGIGAIPGLSRLLMSLCSSSKLGRASATELDSGSPFRCNVRISIDAGEQVVGSSANGSRAKAADRVKADA